MKPVTKYSIDTQRAAQLNPSDYVNVYSFSAAEVKAISIPSGYKVAGFSSTGNFFVNFNGHIASGSAKTDGTGDELNPTTRWVDTLTTIYVYAPAAITLVVAYYGDQ